MKHARGIVLGLLVFSAPGLRASVAQEAAPTTYQDHVLPIFTNHCTGCHNADKKKGDLDLSTYSATMAGGGSGDVVAPGDSGASGLFKVVAHLADPKMPPKKAKIPDAEIAVIKKWIDGGLIDAPGGKARKSKGPKVDLALNAGAMGKPKGAPAVPEDLLLEPELRTTKSEAVTALAASPWAPVVAVAGQHQVLLYDPLTLDLTGILPFPERRPQVLRFSRSGGLLLAGGGRGAKLGRVVVWDVKTGDRVFEIGEEFDQVLAADLSPDQTHVALGGPGKLIKIFSTKDGELQHSIKKHTDWVTALEFSPDGVLLATGDRSGGLHVWEARTGRIFYSLTGHKGGITDVSWRPDSNLLASSSEDGQVILWEMGNGGKVKGWQAHPATASVKYAQDGKLVTCGRDMLVRAWDGAGTKQRDFEAFSDLALRAVVSHDGSRVIAGDWTGEIRVWAAADGRRLGNLSTNPPSLAERLSADKLALEEARGKAEQVAARLKAAQEQVRSAAAAETVAQQEVLSAQQALADLEAKGAESDKTLAAATQGLTAAQAALAQRQGEAAQKAQAVQAALALIQKTRDELKKCQDLNAELLKQVESDPGKAKDLEAAQKVASEKASELARCSDGAIKAKADADLAANAMEPAQKAVAEAQAVQKQAEKAKAAALAAQAQGKQSLTAIQAKAAESKKPLDAAKAAQALVQQASEASQAGITVLQTRIARWKAAEFNVKVYAAKRELARVQAEYEALGAKGEEARRLAAEAEAKAKAGDQAVTAAQTKIQSLQAALVDAKAAPAKAEAAHKAAVKKAADKDVRVLVATELAARLAEDAKQTPDNATLAQAAAKAKEASELLAKDIAQMATVVAARAADIQKATDAIPAAEKAVVEARTDADLAVKKAADLHSAAKAAAARIAPELAPAEAFRPKVDAAKAQVDALRADYLKLKARQL